MFKDIEMSRKYEESKDDTKLNATDKLLDSWVKDFQDKEANNVYKEELEKLNEESRQSNYSHSSDKNKSSIAHGSNTLHDIDGK